jgi:enoyl-[acyl-carrier protein] reductase II
MAAAFALGAEAVQIGSRFVASVESSAHQSFKEKVINSQAGDTLLSLKKLTPVRLLKNDFFNQVFEAETNGASATELQTILGKARAKKGMFEGDMINGELEIGQVSATIKTILPAAEIVSEIWNEFQNTIKHLSEIK